MTEVYYCKNLDDLKRVMFREFLSFSDMYCHEDGIDEAKIVGCNYTHYKCDECEYEFCLLREHDKEKYVYKHITLNEDLEYNTTFPCVVCIADTYSKNERIAICSISDAKEHTKYGYDWSTW